MQPTKPGLVIRRRPEDAASAAPEAAPDASNATAVAPVPEPVAAVAAPEPAPAPVVAPAPVHAAHDAPNARTWRSEAISSASAPEEVEAPKPQRDNNAPLPSTDDFAAMFGGSSVTLRSYEPGERVRAPVVSFGRDVVFVNLGGKSEGVIDSAELLDADGKLTVAIGDMVEAYVSDFRGGSVKLTRGLGRGGDGNEAVEQAHANGIPVEGRVSATNKGGFEVDLLGKRAFCPFSQIDADGSGQEPDRFVGQTLRFLITQVTEGGDRVVVSRAALQRREREEKAGVTLEQLKPDLELDGIVTRVADFGAFVDIGGVDGLVHVSELSWGRAEKAGDLVKVGDRVRVRVLRIDDIEDPKNRRIALSMKALQEDPWHTTVREMSVGGNYSGTVTRLERFGAFVELRPGVEGLVHISEIATSKRITHPKEILNVGDAVQVQLVGMDPRKRQLELSIKATQSDPWSAAASQFAAGMAVQGTVEAIEKFGVFIELPGGLRGLLPLSQLGEGDEKQLHTRFRQGNAVEVRVLEVDAARRRLTLTRRTDVEGDNKAVLAEYRASQSRNEGLGTFAELLARRNK